MIFQTLISTSELASNLDDPNWAVLDCRFSLAEVQSGHQNYLQAHLPGACYADLDRDLSSPHIPGITGRHPLPTIDLLVEKFSAWGINPEVQVVCYDDAGGALAAARAWWLLRWLGHSNVAVLDGGWQKWLAEGRPIHSGNQTRPPGSFKAKPRPELLLTAAEVEKMRSLPGWRLLDARGYDRFCGNNETIDPIAGHIPGAVSAPYADNLTAELVFQPVDVLNRRFTRLLSGIPAERSVFYCGSGVTAAHNILAVLHAGFGEALLFAGSWSEWITDPDRPSTAGPD